MRLLRRVGCVMAAGLPLAMGTSTLACSGSADDAAADGDTTSQDALTGAQCREVNKAYAACLRSETDDYRECVTTAQQNLLQGVVDTLIGTMNGAIPCAGPALSGLITAKCIATFDSDPVGCMTSIVESILSNVQASQGFSACAEKTGEAMTKQWKSTMKANVYATLAYLAAHTTAFVVAYDTCATKYASGNDGCEPVACNANRILCFDAPSCPTIGVCRGGTTHITGIFKAENVRDGYAYGDNGARLARCVSKKTMGGSLAGQCQGDKSVSQANACSIHQR